MSIVIFEVSIKQNKQKLDMILVLANIYKLSRARIAVPKFCSKGEVCPFEVKAQSNDENLTKYSQFKGNFKHYCLLTWINYHNAILTGGFAVLPQVNYDSAVGYCLHVGSHI